MMKPIGHAVTTLNIVMPVLTIGLVLGSLAIRMTGTDNIDNSDGV